MLVLSRKLGEQISIQGGITITVVKVGRNKVQLGIDATAGYDICRPETKEKQAKAPSTPEASDPPIDESPC